MTKRAKAEWQSLFEAFAVSGLSMAAFCRQHALCAKNFSAKRREWLEETGSQEKHRTSDVAPMPATSSPFVPVRVTDALSDSCSVSRSIDTGTVRLHYQQMTLTLEQASPEFVCAIMKRLT